MRELNIAYGNNRQAKRWVNKTIRFDNLKERLKVTIRTTESAEEYAKMSRAQRDAAKDHGGFVAGVLKGGRRKVDTVESRSMVALDGDRIDAGGICGGVPLSGSDAGHRLFRRMFLPAQSADVLAVHAG